MPRQDGAHEQEGRDEVHRDRLAEGGRRGDASSGAGRKSPALLTRMSGTSPKASRMRATAARHRALVARRRTRTSIAPPPISCAAALSASALRASSATRAPAAAERARDREPDAARRAGDERGAPHERRAPGLDVEPATARSSVPQRRPCASERNSSRVRASLRKRPRTADVTVCEFCFCTPRIIMQRWYASITTPTPRGIEHVLDRLRDLLGEPLLHLEPAREHLDDARQLREPDDAPVGDVRDVRLAEEGQQVVLAERVQLDVAHHHHAAGAIPRTPRRRRRRRHPGRSRASAR